MQKPDFDYIWTISSLVFHTLPYRKRYLGVLKKIMSSEDKNLAILDTACGIGFPSIDLYDAGFTNISCSDASYSFLKIIKEKVNPQIHVFQALWEELSEKAGSQFDVVLNVDNSLVYMDGWGEKQLRGNVESIFERMLLALRNFYQCLKPGGKLIVALTKRNSLGKTKDKIVFPEITYKGQKVKVVWEAFFNWETRTKIWTLHTKFRNQKYQLTFKSYLLILDELTHLMKQAGFINVQIVNTHAIRDNLLVGYRPLA